MPHLYRILHGQEFRDSDGTLKGPGATIELEDDVAARYAGNLEKIEAAPDALAGVDVHTDGEPG